MKIKDFIELVNSWYPNELKEIWDPSGYSVKTVQAKKFTGAVLAIDLTEEVLNEAIENGCNVILTHHPFKFEAMWKTEDYKAPYKREILKKLRQHQITSYSMHTNYDCNEEGTSYQIARYLGIQDKLNKELTQKYSAVIDANLSVRELAQLLKSNLKLDSFRTNVKDDQLDKKQATIAFLSGSGYIGQIVDLSKSIDLIVSSDFRWSDWIVFDQCNISILEVPHLDEQVFAWHMFERLTQELPDKKFVLKEIPVPYKNL
ncbi:Nif3-like dinuclear metal center hexameric protein [Mycoplasma sp. Pen4]|nr:Nif3-like dinuclear metal center hexameric protein [Mycoplasma sp. Pen4]